MISKNVPQQLDFPPPSSQPSLFGVFRRRICCVSLVHIFIIALLSTYCECVIEVWSVRSILGSLVVVAVFHFLWRCSCFKKPRYLASCRHGDNNESCIYNYYPSYSAPGGLHTLFEHSSVWLLFVRLLRYYLLPSYTCCCQTMQRSLHQRASSFSSDDSRPSNTADEPLPPPVLVYHESARSIVFRDHVRRADAKKHAKKKKDETKTEIQVANFQPVILPLQPLELGPQDQFQALLEEGSNEASWNTAEKEVVGLLKDEYAVVKTLRNSDWTGTSGKISVCLFFTLES